MPNDIDLSSLSDYECDDITGQPERSIYNNGCQHDWKVKKIYKLGTEYTCKCGLSRFEYHHKDESE